jgi:hypothetical protein
MVNVEADVLAGPLVAKKRAAPAWSTRWPMAISRADGRDGRRGAPPVFAPSPPQRSIRRSSRRDPKASGATWPDGRRSAIGRHDPQMFNLLDAPIRDRNGRDANATGLTSLERVTVSPCGVDDGCT